MQWSMFLRVLEVSGYTRISSIHSSSCITWPGYQIMSQEDVTFLLRDPRVPNQLLHSKWIKIEICATQICVRHNMDVDYLSAKYQVLKSSIYLTIASIFAGTPDEVPIWGITQRTDHNSSPGVMPPHIIGKSNRWGSLMNSVVGCLWWKGSTYCIFW